MLALWEQCGLIENEADIVREEITAKMTRDPELFLVYELKGEILGTVVGGWDGWRGWIYKSACQANAEEKESVAPLLKKSRGD